MEITTYPQETKDKLETKVSNHFYMVENEGREHDFKMNDEIEILEILLGIERTTEGDIKKRGDHQALNLVKKAVLAESDLLGRKDRDYDEQQFYRRALKEAFGYHLDDEELHQLANLAEDIKRATMEHVENYNGYGVASHGIHFDKETLPEYTISSEGESIFVA